MWNCFLRIFSFAFEKTLSLTPMELHQLKKNIFTSRDGEYTKNDVKNA